MQLADLFTALDDVGLTPDVHEVADALWLASLWQRGAAGSASGPGGVDSTAADPGLEPESGATGIESSGASWLEPQTAAPADDTEPPRSGAAGAEGSFDHGGERSAAGGPPPSRRRFARSLRPLKRRIPIGPPVVFDEAATAESSARAGTLMLELRPRSERWLDAAVVADDSESMELWEDERAGLVALLKRSGVFRRVTASRFRPQAGLAPLRAARGVPGGPSTLFLVFTDGVADFWRTEAALGFLEPAALRAPLALLQPLSEALWPRTALRPRDGLFRTPDRGAPAAAASFARSGRRSRRSPGGARDPFALPVLGLDGRRIESWARFVAGPRGARLEAPAYLLGGPPAPGPRSNVVPDPQDPRQLFEKFAAVSTPAAQRLAMWLSVCAVLTTQVMRHVQQLVIPDGGTEQLAEVLLGGLLVRGAAPDAMGNVLYSYPEDLRRTLASWLPVDAAAQLFRDVTEFVARDLGGTGLENAVMGSLSYQMGRIGQEIEQRQGAPMNRNRRVRDAESFVDSAGVLTERERRVRAAELFSDLAERTEDPVEALGQRRLAAAAVADLRIPITAETQYALAEAALARCDQTGRLEYLDESIAAFRLAVAGPGLPTPWHRLAEALLRRAEATKAQDPAAAEQDAREAVSMYRSGLTDVPAEYPDARVSTRQRTGAVEAALLHGSLTRARADYDWAVELAREVRDEVPRGHPEHPARAAGLAEALRRRHEFTGSVIDLDESLLMWQEAAKDATGIERFRCLMGQASALEARYLVAGNTADETAAAKAYQDASEVSQARGVDRATALAGLARTLAEAGRTSAAMSFARQALAVFDDLGAYRHPEAVALRELQNAERDEHGVADH